jgi:nanoRNase/pAp phosphatase (c-di-AMP/oligoRNAs hydrolase)
LTVDFLKYFKIALDNKRVRKGHMFAHLGSVTNPDICVIIADFFMKISSVNWSIVSGLYSKKLIIVFRNDGLRKDAGKLARQSFGQIGSAGGHKSMARAEISFEALKEVVDYMNDKKLLRWIINKIEKKTVKK